MASKADRSYAMKERAEEILNELLPEGAAEHPADLTAHVYARRKYDEVVVWLEGGEELGQTRQTTGALRRAVQRVEPATCPG